MVLGALRPRGLRLGILSNAWPSLERKYALLGLRHFFDAFIISARLGCVKPDERMYRTGLAGLNLPPQDVIFVDDWPEFVRVAVDLGMQGAVMDRAGVQEVADLPRVRSMPDVLALLA